MLHAKKTPENITRKKTKDVTKNKMKRRREKKNQVKFSLQIRRISVTRIIFLFVSPTYCI